MNADPLPVEPYVAPERSEAESKGVLLRRADELIGVLHDEARLFVELEALAREHRDHLAGNAPDQLAGLQRRMETAVVRLRVLREARLLHGEHIARELRIGDGGSQIADLARLVEGLRGVSGDAAGRLEGARRRVLALTERLARLNRQCGGLARSGLDYAGAMVASLSCLAGETYQESGTVRSLGREVSRINWQT